jgi:hypothetical protein|tara:strand:+ start:1427 stop:1666 length:240 start_codon:yes stop_codon:yes gene_type:complete
MADQSVEINAKIKLGALVKSIEPIVAKQLEAFTPAEIEYVLANYRKFLSYDLSRDFENNREKNLKESPFDAIINDNLDL